MKPDMFKTPVIMLTGLGMPKPVNSVVEAYSVVLDWPAHRDPARALVLNACRAALSGDIDVETARSVFLAFAEKHDLLAPDLSVVAAVRHGHTDDPHRP